MIDAESNLVLEVGANVLAAFGHIHTLVPSPQSSTASFGDGHVALTLLVWKHSHTTLYFTHIPYRIVHFTPNGGASATDGVQDMPQPEASVRQGCTAMCAQCQGRHALHLRRYGQW